MNKENIIKLNEISFAYPGQEKVLLNISLEIYRGEFLVLMGPNGAAKTTLLRLVLGLLKPLQGTIEMARDTVLGYIPQKALFNPGFPATVMEAVMLQAKPGNKANKSLVEQSLKKVNLWEKRASHLGNLSGGQFQRMLIARSLINIPRVLILDEPFTGLDSQGQEEYLNLLIRLNREGLTIIMVTHDPAPILDCASRFFFLSGGTIREISKDILKVV
jgi:zinc transport system ATP-binding protein